MKTKISLIETVLLKVKIEKKFFIFLANIIFVFSFAVLTGIGSKIKIEIGLVPITFQTLFVLLSGAFLGAKKGAMSQLTYLLLGLLGLPWFSRGGGVNYILNPTFGYILGFIFSSYFVGFLFEKGWSKNFLKTIFVFTLGNFLIYIPGLFWLEKFVGPDKILAVGFFPFICGDVLKILTAAIIFFNLNPRKFKNIKVF